MALDTAGNLFIVDFFNSQVRRRDAATGIITTVAGGGGALGDGGPATSAKLSSPFGLAVDFDGNLFIADSGNHRVRKVDAATQVISTVAGTGTLGFSGDGGAATGAELHSPFGVDVDLVGNLYIADYRNHRIRSVEGAAAQTPFQVPSLSQWGLIAMGALMAAVVLWRLRHTLTWPRPAARKE